MKVLGQMMTEPLLLASVLTHAEKYHGDEEVVSQMPGGQLHRYTYRDLGRRVRSTAGVLADLGLHAGACIATLAWNTHRHLELYFAIPCLGSVCHTINPRLFHEQIVYIINHAEDAALFFDVSFAPLVATLRSRCPTVKYWIALAEADGVPPETPFAQSYEALLARQQGFPEWPSFDENTACLLCYTSGTTGNPKGVLFSHRTTLLHSLATALPDALAVSASEVVCPVVPMFHANGWGLPFTCPMVGAKLVLAGMDTDGESLYRLFEAEGVTFAGAVPTVWQGLIDHLQAHGLRFSSLRRFLVGGASCPPSIIRTMWQDYGVDALPGWGMTELSPIGTLTTAKRKHCALGTEERLELKSNHGRPLFGVDLRLRGMNGEELPCDGQAVGELQVRGLWTVERYFRSEQSALVDGWFSTGDIATIDGDGYLRITDRSKGHRDDRWRRLPQDHRPFQGHDQERRGMDQLDRAGEYCDVASGRGHGCGNRRRQWQVGRASLARRRAAVRWRTVDQAGVARVVRGQGCQVVDTGRRAVRSGAADDGNRQALEAHAAQAVSGLSTARRGRKSSQRRRSCGNACSDGWAILGGG